METLIIWSIAVFTLFLIAMLIETKENKMQNIQLAPIGIYTLPSTGEQVDLSEYYLDKFGNLYSANPDTWEVNPIKKRNLLICSNNCINKSGDMINSLRSKGRKKVTIARKKLSWKELANTNGIVEVIGTKSTNRHINVTSATRKAV